MSFLVLDGYQLGVFQQHRLPCALRIIALGVVVLWAG